MDAVVAGLEERFSLPREVVSPPALEERFSLPREVVSPSAIFISIAIILVNIQPPKVW